MARRSSSVMYNGLWKAHESGITVSSAGSRRSISLRGSVVAAAATHGLNASLRGTQLNQNSSHHRRIGGGGGVDDSEHSVFGANEEHLIAAAASAFGGGGGMSDVATVSSSASSQFLSSSMLSKQKSVTYSHAQAIFRDSSSARRPSRTLHLPNNRNNKGGGVVVSSDLSSVSSFPPSIHLADPLRSDSVHSMLSSSGHSILGAAAAGGGMCVPGIPSYSNMHASGATATGLNSSFHRYNRHASLTSSRHSTHRVSVLKNIDEKVNTSASSLLVEEEEEEKDVSGEEMMTTTTTTTASDKEKDCPVTPLLPPSSPSLFLRRASVNTYGGEGFEIEASPAFAADTTSRFSFIEQDLAFSSLSFIEGRKDDEKVASENQEEHFDAWNVLKDEYCAIGYGANGTLPFLILGTSADDIDSTPHVLSPPLMESLQSFLPFAKSEDNYWMKYSMARDGASLHTLLQHIRGATHTIIAIETVDGEVMGSFTSAPWRKNWNYFGTGESFLWRMRQGRNTPCYSIIDQAQLESELDVYPWTGANDCVQLCTQNKIAVGGGGCDSSMVDMTTPFGSGSEAKQTDNDDNTQYGFGLAIESDLLHATSSRCATFGSPALSRYQSDGSPMEIINLEVWALTPSMSSEGAEKLELGKLFLEDNYC